MVMNALQQHRRPESYDVMQVCLNGHKITEYATTRPITREAFCSQCGARTISACEGCKKPIRGYRHGSMVPRTTPVPKYCDGCGVAHPWHAAAVENLKDVLRESGMTETDMEEASSTLPDVLSETPKTEGAALKFRRLIGKLGKPAYDVALRVVSDVASETAKRTFGLG